MQRSQVFPVVLKLKKEFIPNNEFTFVHCIYQILNHENLKW